MVEVPPNILGQGKGGRVAAIPILLQSLLDDGLHVAAQRLVQSAQRSGGHFANQARKFVSGRILEIIGHAFRQQFEEDHAQGVDITPRVNITRIGLELLRTHVLQSPNPFAGTGLSGRNR